MKIQNIQLIKVLVTRFKSFFSKATPAPQPMLSFGERQSDGFASVLEDGVPTQVRFHVFEKEDFMNLRAIAEKIDDDLSRQLEEKVS